jgi:methylthioribose-1-phosphate isomerase
MGLPKTIEIKNRQVFIVDQTLIPAELVIIEIDHLEAMYEAILSMKIRGAPAIGVAGIAGMALYVDGLDDNADYDIDDMTQACARLESSRPTAVNLSWGLRQVIDLFASYKTVCELKVGLWAFAEEKADDDIRVNRQMGVVGADLFNGHRLLAIATHCNAGSLATVYWGTALGVIRELNQRKQLKMVFADETRPRLQGGKITSFELMADNIAVTVIADNMMASLMAKGQIDAVIVGADRIAANGDVANKIGTYCLAICANYHRAPFYVAAPISTVDFDLVDGSLIPIEERDQREMTHSEGALIMPEGVITINPAFDVTPAKLITGFFTEKGVVSGDFKRGLSAFR